MALEKNDHEHHERALPVSDENAAHHTPKSTKRAVAAWFVSAFLCGHSPRIWISSRIRSRHGHCRHEEQQSYPLDTELQVTTINRNNTSQLSATTFLIEDSLCVAPVQPINKVELEAESSATPSPYQTMPYDNSIRLLRIHKGALSEPLEITLNFARLGNTIPEYEALSYVWGSSVPVSHIVDKTTQTPIPVTRNLYDALKGLRQTEKDCVLWVDALCINQNDREEKSIQVRKMNHIYTYAACVIVWLGSDDAGDANGAFGVLCSLAKIEGKCAHYGTGSQSEVPHIPDRIIDSRDYEVWRKVMMFFCHAWFTRVWVLQEIILAQDALFAWGDCSISWTFVGAAINSIRKIAFARGLLQTRNFHNAFLMWHLSTVCRNSRSIGHGNRSRSSRQPDVFPFLHLLDIARSFEATDPRDKVYGLLGLPTLCNDLNANCFVPDYSLSVGEVYGNITRSYIVKEKNLDILALVLDSPPEAPLAKGQMNDVPSWAPMFNSNATAAPISNMNIEHQYSAGYSRPLSCRPSASPHILRLEGIVLDVIRETGPSIPFVQAHTLHDHLEPLIQWYVDAGVTISDLSVILTGGRDRDGRLLSPAQREDCAVFLLGTMGDNSLDTSALSTQSMGPDRNACLKWRDTLERFIAYRQAFVTSRGILGLGRQGLKNGDTVAALWGGQCPVIVRDAGQDQWLLRGECYVEAWMNGNTVAKLMREGEKESMVFDFV